MSLLVTGESIYISAKSGKKKDGEAWYNLKFLDDENDEFFSAFVSSGIYNHFCNIPKKTAVILTLSIVPGVRYFTVENIEVVE